MTFIKVNSIDYNPLDSDKVELGTKLIINADSIELCEKSDVSIVEENWIMPATLGLLKLDVAECNMDEYATEIVLKSGNSVLVVESLDCIYNQINQ